MKSKLRKRMMALVCASTVLFGGMIHPVTSMDVEASATWIWNEEYSESGYKKVPYSVLTAKADSQQTSGENSSTLNGTVVHGKWDNIVDGSTDSFWHTRYNDGDGSSPTVSDEGFLTANNTVTISIDEEEGCNVRGITVLPRQDGYGNGAFIQFDVKVSDGTTWFDATSDFVIKEHGNAEAWEINKAEKEVIFESSYAGIKKIQIVVERSGASGRNNTDGGTGNHISVAEISVLTEEQKTMPVYVSSDCIASVSTGSAEGGYEGQKVIDDNPNTSWHTAYNNQNDSLLWIDFEFSEKTQVDGVRVLQKPEGLWQNGYILGYEVWVCSDSSLVNDNDWKASYTKVCEGTWNRDSTKNTWRSAQFEAVEVERIRLVATDTYEDYTHPNERYASILEMRVTTPISDGSDVEYAKFLGGSLRERGYEDGTSTAMRLGYNIPDVDGLTVSTWKWDCGFATTDESGNITSYTFKETVVAPEGQPQPNWTNKTVYGDRVSNVVIKGVPSASYNQAIYSQLIITYTNSANEELTVYTKMEARSVAQVVGKILDEGSENPDYAYADTITKVMQGK